MVDPDGHPLVVYRSSGVRLARCTDPASCASVDTLEPAEFGNEPTMTLGADGSALIAFRDGSDLRLARCTPSSCADFGSADDANARDPSIALAADGSPIVSFFANSSNNLGLARCESPTSCDDPEVVIVDPEQYVGVFSAVTLTADGRPIIIYWTEDAFDDVRVALCESMTRCDAPDILTLWPLSGDDEEGGRYPAIVLGADGLPVITFEDETASPARPHVVFCGNTSCAPYLRTGG